MFLCNKEKSKRFFVDQQLFDSMKNHYAFLSQLLPGNSLDVDCVTAYCRHLASGISSSSFSNGVVVDLMSPVVISSSTASVDRNSVRSLINDGLSLNAALTNRKVKPSIYR